MSNKYPLIQDTNTTRVRKLITPGPTGDDAVATLLTESVLSTSDGASLKTMFKHSPIYTLANDVYRVAAKAALSPKFQEGDLNQFPGGVNLDYSGSPDLSAGIVTTDETFDSPYYPNLIANSDPAGGPGTGTGTPLEANDNFGSGNKIDVNGGPSKSSELLAATDAISFPPNGTAPGQSNAHSAFPGALTNRTS